MATNLQKITDAAGREAYLDPKTNMVYTEGGRNNTNYTLDAWNQRQLNKYGAPKSSSSSSSSNKKPQNYSELENYLKNFQKTIKEQRELLNSPLYAPKTDEQLMNEIKQNVIPTTPAPTPTNLVELFQNLRSDADLQDLENRATELDGLAQDIEANLRERIGIEEGKPVALNVISGRVGEAERQELFRLDFVGRQLGRVQSQIESKYKVIDTIVNLTNTDYNNAVSQYNTQFQQNLAMYQVLRQERSEQRAEILTDIRRAEDKAFDITKTLISWEREDKIREEESARANLQIYAGLIKSGNMNLGNIPSSMRGEISKLEISSGLGVGFLSKITRDNPNGEIITTSTRVSGGVKYADIILRDANGQLKTQTMNLGYTAEGTTASTATERRQAVLDQAYSDMSTKLQTVSGGDGRVAPNDYIAAKKKWVSLGFNAKEFDETFSVYANPNHLGDYGLPETY